MLYGNHKSRDRNGNNYRHDKSSNELIRENRPNKKKTRRYICGFYNQKNVLDIY